MTPPATTKRNGARKRRGRFGWGPLALVGAALLAACDRPHDPVGLGPDDLTFSLQTSSEGGDLLPDLGFARIGDLSVERLRGGVRLLRFSTTIVNVGAGAFEVRGERGSTSESEMSVFQRIYGEDGGVRELSTPATMTWGGDGHDHWHVMDLVDARLITLDRGQTVARSNKIDFCIFDNREYDLSLSGAPSSIQYEERGCGRQGDLEATMGLSVGWGDRYPYWMPGQYVDISHVGSGTFRLILTVDPEGWFTEGDTSNNRTWVDIELRGNGNQLRVLGYGPSA